MLAGRQVGLGDIAGDHRARAEADARQEHLHLLDGGVLRLIEDDEGVIERAAAHEGERRHLDDVALDEARDAIEAHHLVERVVHRPQVRIDLLRQIARAGTRAARPPRPPGAPARCAARGRPAAPPPRRPPPDRSCRCRPDRCRRSGRCCGCARGTRAGARRARGCRRAARCTACSSPRAGPPAARRSRARAAPGARARASPPRCCVSSNSSRSVSSALAARAPLTRKRVAAAADPHAEPLLEQPQVLIERPAQVRQARVVGGLESRIPAAARGDAAATAISRWPPRADRRGGSRAAGRAGVCGARLGDRRHRRSG